MSTLWEKMEALIHNHTYMGVMWGIGAFIFVSALVFLRYDTKYGTDEKIDDAFGFAASALLLGALLPFLVPAILFVVVVLVSVGTPVAACWYTIDGLATLVYKCKTCGKKNDPHPEPTGQRSED
jgi:divalent metal cation (Fe/Co/Zn/Cd) transporter